MTTETDMQMHPGSHWSGEWQRPEGVQIDPPGDRIFAAAVRRHTALSRSAGELEARLRERFPRVQVRSQVSDGRGVPTWFVYRDGLWSWDRGEDTLPMPQHVIPIVVDRPVGRRIGTERSWGLSPKR